MSVVSSNMIMGEGDPRVVGGWVLLPLVGERFMVWWGGCLWQPPLRFEKLVLRPQKLVFEPS